MTDEHDAVAAALERSQRDRVDAMDASIDAPRSRLTFMFAVAYDDRAVLAAEVERLRRIVDAARGVEALYLAGDIDCSQRVDDALGWLHITLEDGHDDA